jgi:hypothetical protein
MHDKAALLFYLMTHMSAKPSILLLCMYMSDSPCLSVFLFVCHPVCLFQPMASYLFACFDCTFLGKLIFGVLKFCKEMESAQYRNKEIGNKTGNLA